MTFVARAGKEVGITKGSTGASWGHHDGRSLVSRLASHLSCSQDSRWSGLSLQAPALGKAMHERHRW
jgi:hypothetical protein